MSVNYGCVKLLDSMRVQQNILEKLTDCSKDQDYIHLKQKFPNHWMIPKKKLAYPYEHYKSLKDY